MKKINKVKDHYDEDVIYVSECTKYEYENQEIANKSIKSLHKEENVRIDDIIKMVENYYI